MKYTIHNKLTGEVYAGLRFAEAAFKVAEELGGVWTLEASPINSQGRALRRDGMTVTHSFLPVMAVAEMLCWEALLKKMMDPAGDIVVTVD